MSETTERRARLAATPTEPAGYRCDHSDEATSSHHAWEHVEGEGYVFQHQPNTISAYTHVDQPYLKPEDRERRCPRAVPVYTADVPWLVDLLKQYIGVEPTVLEELEHASRCATAVYEVIDEAKRTGKSIDVAELERAAEGDRPAPADHRQLDQARAWAVALENETTRLTKELAELASRARRVADSHRNFMDDHSDPGTEALCAQYELVNRLAALPEGEDLPVNMVESALHLVLALLDQYEEDVTPQEIRKALADALPRDDKSDRRRRVYIDGKGNGWLSHSVDLVKGELVARFDTNPWDNGEAKADVQARAGLLRETGRVW